MNNEDKMIPSAAANA